MNRPCIDQFAAAVAAGDGLTSGPLFTCSLLRELGYASDIHSFAIPETLLGDILPAERFVAENCALRHYALLGVEQLRTLAAWLAELGCALPAKE